MNFKQLFVILFLLLNISSGYTQQGLSKKINTLKWLTGKWHRTNAKEGQSGYEIWEKGPGQGLRGKGVTLRGKKVLFVEQLQLIARGDDILYTVVVTGEKKKVFFKLTALDNDGFTAENAQHDFPKKITYRHSGDRINAVVSGKGQTIVYDFELAKGK